MFVQFCSGSVPIAPANEPPTITSEPSMIPSFMLRFLPSRPRHSNRLWRAESASRLHSTAAGKPTAQDTFDPLLQFRLRGGGLATGFPSEGETEPVSRALAAHNQHQASQRTTSARM